MATSTNENQDKQTLGDNMKTAVIMNEQHTLFEQQTVLLNQLGEWELITIPSEGMDKERQDDLISSINHDCVVFASPIPYMLKEFSKLEGQGNPQRVLVMHNDKREKKELPNGKVISVTSKDGWELV